MRRRLAVAIACAALGAFGCSGDRDGGADRVKPPPGGEGGEGGDGGGSGGDLGEGGAGGEGGEGGGVAGGPPDVVGENLRFWGAAQGLPRHVRGVSVDRGGNVWAADGAFLLRLPKGAEIWERYGEADGLSPYPPISVAGGRDGEVWVGYEGVFPDEDPFDDPPAISKTGDVDRIRLTGAGLDRLHYDISSGPGPGYENGRDVVRTCYRIVPVLDGPYAGDVWFGCNHGVSMWNARFGGVQEHQHTYIELAGSMASGDFRSLALMPNGDVWLAGDHNGGLLRYASEGGQFWASISPVVDMFPPGRSFDPDGHDWNMALVHDGSGGFFVAGFGNGLARRSAGGAWSYWTTANGLPDNRVYDLALDPDGSLWIATDAGVTRLAGGSFGTPINNMNGLPGVPTSLAIDATSRPRRLIVGSSTGVLIYDGP